MLKSTTFVFLYLMALPFFSLGQIGGKRSFEFLNIPGNARIAALGGVNTSLFDEDVNLMLSNPAALHDEVSRHLSLSHLFYYADISHSALTYAHTFDKVGTFGVGLQYMDYGEFESFDEAGANLGTFNAQEYAITVGHSRIQGNFRMGGNIKLAVSNIGPYASSAVMADLGGLFIHPHQPLTIGLSFKNIGFPLRGYTPDAEMELPFDVQLGATFKPEYMPFRFSVTAFNLYLGDITYFDPASTIGGNQDEPGTVDRVLRHFAFGTELLLSKNVNLRAGYNHLIRKELRLDQASGGAGFSWGLMFRVNTFEFAYTKAYYHVAGGTNYLTLSHDFNEIFRNKKEL